MKKVLLISYHFPPLPNIGSRRPFGLAKYLPGFGWEPIVLTPKVQGRSFGEIRVIETDYKDVSGFLKSKLGFNAEKSLHEQLGIAVSKNYTYSTWKSKFIKLCKEIITYPDPKKGWYDFAVKSAIEFLNTKKVDVIISSSPPIITHLVARKLKRKYKIPWIADLRDPWTQIYINNKYNIIKYFDKRLEIKTLRDADALVSVSEPYVKKINNLHKTKKIFCITNGYDPDDFTKIPTKLTDKFTITYTGILYNGRRDPSLLFDAVAQLLQENKINRKLLDIRFYCEKEEWLAKEIHKYNLADIINLNGLVSRDEIIERQRESQVLLLIRWDSQSEIGDCPAKIYEYLGAGRPIIAIGGHGGIVKDLLEKTNAGKFAENPGVLKNILLEYYKEFLNFGSVKSNFNDNINNYTYGSIAEKYSEVLNRLIFK